jgi:DNA helicase HerA-like ATPase
LIGDKVYSAPHSLLSKIPLLVDVQNREKQDSSVLLSIGCVGVAEESEVKITPERLFGRHCAILGTTGGGKSWTVARIIEECMKYRAKAILLDATGEYCGFSGKDIKHCCLGTSPDTTDAIEVSLPQTR